MKGYIHNMILFAAASMLWACSSEDDALGGKDKFEGFGKPMQITVTMDNEDGITRSSYLSISKTVFITPDIGRSKWYAYNYDNTTGLWKATKEFTSTDGGVTWSNTTTTQGLIWTSETMLIYAVVRNDNLPTAANKGPLSDVMSIAVDQTDESKYNAQAILGTMDRVSYNTGKITLHLQHILGRVVVNVNNCSANQAWTCTSWGKGQHGSNMGINVTDSWAYYYSQGYLRIGDDQFTFDPVTTSLANFQCWRYYAQGTNTKFCCWMVPPYGVCICFCFKLNYGNSTHYTKNTSYGGISLVSGKTSTINATLP